MNNALFLELIFQENAFVQNRYSCFTEYAGLLSSLIKPTNVAIAFRVSTLLTRTSF